MEFPPDSLQPLVDAITSSLLPALTGRDSWPELALQQMFLPVRCGGLGLPDVANVAASEYTASIHVCTAYMNAILQQTAHPPHQPKSLKWLSRIAEVVQEIRDAVAAAKAEVKSEKRAIVREKTEALQQALPAPALRALSSIQVKGASSWLSVVPLHEHGFSLAKGDFRDALALRFSWPLRSVPTHCVCGKDFSTPHAMVCPCGGFTIIRHNEVRDLLASQLTEVCGNVAVEPTLAPVSGEQFSRSVNTADGARADIRARGFWTSHEDAFFDIRVFCPDAASYLSSSPGQLFAQHERLKRNEYVERIVNINRGSFSPLVFSTQGGTGQETTCFLKRLASKISDQSGRPYSVVMGWLLCRLSFALLRSAIMCVRGARSAYHRPQRYDVELASVEARVPPSCS